MPSIHFKKAIKATEHKDFVKPEVVKFMDVSTAHITKTDAEKLDSSNNAACGELSFDRFEYGYYVYIPDQSTTDRLPMSSAFKTLMHYARESGFRAVKLDCDATNYPQLASFTW